MFGKSIPKLPKSRCQISLVLSSVDFFYFWLNILIQDGSSPKPFTSTVKLTFLMIFFDMMEKISVVVLSKIGIRIEKLLPNFGGYSAANIEVSSRTSIFMLYAVPLQNYHYLGKIKNQKFTT